MKKHFYSILRTISSIYGHYNLQNSETTESGVDNVVSSCEKNPNVHKTYMNFLRQRKTALDAPLNVVSSGRSMVEMLGVLAIIGVLSVGAISGYSKAMFKYKLNKQTESFSILLNEAIKLYPDMRHQSESKNVSILMDKLNLIPDGMSFKNNIIYDVFKNTYELIYAVGTRANGNSYMEYYLNITLQRNHTKLTNQDREICRNTITAAKENANNLAAISMHSGNTDGSYNTTALYGGLAGMFLETVPSNRLLHNADINKIDDLCSSCDSERYCSFLVYITIEN